MLDFAKNSSIEFLRNDGSIIYELDIKSRRNLAFGAGYKFKDRYGLELRYQTNREVLSDYVYWISDYNTLSIIVGYSLF